MVLTHINTDQCSNKRASKLSWISGEFDSQNRVALLIPQFNEYSRTNFVERLNYFRKLALQFKDVLDVVLIDDGSTDCSLNKIIEFNSSFTKSFFVASVFPNANKVGALRQVSMEISHEFVILSDFDTDLVGLKEVIDEICNHQNDVYRMGYYFRMIPYEGSGAIFLFQQLEYCFARVFYKFHNHEKSVPVMPGAGCCFKREILNSIFEVHSGLRNGEDRESTLIGIRLGYSVSYLETVLALTRPPLTYKKLVSQRIRWNLGYLETLLFERKFYFKQIFKLTILGLRTVHDISCAFFTLLLPLILVFFCIYNTSLLLVFLLVYFAYLVTSFLLLRTSKQEYREFRNRIIEAVLVYPFIAIAVDFVAWSGAISRFIRKNYSNLRQS